MKISSANTFRGLMVVTVASGIVFAATSSSYAWNPFKKDRGENIVVEGELRRPAYNPAGEGSAADVRAPMDNPGAADDEFVRNETVVTTPPPPRSSSPQAQRQGGAFSWLYKDGGEGREAASASRAPSQQAPAASPSQGGGSFSWLYKDGGGAEAAAAQPQVDTMQRQVPQYNQQVTAGAQFEPEMTMSAPVDGVSQAHLGTPFQPASLEAQASADMEAGFPNLSEVPASPQRLNQLDSGAQMAELEAARAESQAMQAQYASSYNPETDPMPAAMEHDPFAADPMSMPVVPQASGQADASMTAMAPWEEQAPAAAPAPMASEGEMDLNAEFASIVGGNATAQTTTAMAPSQDVWTPQPMVAPQTHQVPNQQYASAAPVTPVEEGEWVDLTAGSNEIRPVDQVAIAPVPTTAAAPIRPVEPQWNARSAVPVQAAPRVRLLPESRYAARRQAVYAQRYARHNGLMSQ